MLRLWAVITAATVAAAAPLASITGVCHRGGAVIEVTLGVWRDDSNRTALDFGALSASKSPHSLLVTHVRPTVLRRG